MPMHCVHSFIYIGSYEPTRNTKIKRVFASFFIFVPTWASCSVKTAGLTWRCLHGLPWNPEVCQRDVSDIGDSWSMSPGHPF